MLPLPEEGLLRRQPRRLRSRTPLPSTVALTVEPCPVCGVKGACSYDRQGRPLIHTDTELPEDHQ